MGVAKKIFEALRDNEESVIDDSAELESRGVRLVYNPLDKQPYVVRVLSDGVGFNFDDEQSAREFIKKRFPVKSGEEKVFEPITYSKLEEFLKLVCDKVNRSLRKEPYYITASLKDLDDSVYVVAQTHWPEDYEDEEFIRMEATDDVLDDVMKKLELLGVKATTDFSDDEESVIEDLRNSNEGWARVCNVRKD